LRAKLLARQTPALNEKPGAKAGLINLENVSVAANGVYA